MPTFLDLGVPAPLANVLAADGKTEAFPIQRDTLPDSLAGHDVLGRGRTGSGKTIAFALPLVARLSGAFAAGRTTGRPRGLVLAPTRELATQIAATIQPLAAASGLTVTTVFGGVSQKPQETALRGGVDIVVACPGRLEDLMKQGVVRLDRVEITVLDEADHMADLGFLPGVTRILAATPQGGQRMLFSATLDRGVDGLVRKFLRDEIRHEIDDQSVPQGEMTHRVFMVSDEGSPNWSSTSPPAAADASSSPAPSTRPRSWRRCSRQPASRPVDLHGNLSQAARERNLAAFSADPAKGGVRVLVATDVAARGVHVDEVELVVHVDPPMEHKAYLHRSGRTARAGAAGTVVTVAIPSQRRDVTDLLRKAGIQAPLEQVTAEAAPISALVGERAEHVRPAPVQAAAAAPVEAQVRADPAGSRRSGPWRTGSRSGCRFDPAGPGRQRLFAGPRRQRLRLRSAGPPGLLDRNRSARSRGARPADRPGGPPDGIASRPAQRNALRRTPRLSPPGNQAH